MNKRVKALKAYFEKEMVKGWYVTPDDLIDVAPDLRLAMKAAGVQMFNLKKMPPQMLRGLCKKFGADEGFFRRCTASSLEKHVTDEKAFCAWLHKQCHGKWPGESRAVQLKRLEQVLAQQIYDAIMAGREDEEQETQSSL